MKTYLSLVKFEHTIFALPFAYISMLLAHWSGAHVTGPEVLWVTVAMFSARTLAMALNRLIDAGIDAKNPRTAVREIPSGKLSRANVWGLCAISVTVLVTAVWQLHPIVHWLWPIPVAMFVIYPLTKRFTWLCHLFLGATIGLAAPAAWAGTSGEFNAQAWWLGGAVACWIAGFDIIYASMDVEFDRANNLNSIPARFGIGNGLWIARVLHIATVVMFAHVGLILDLGVAYWIGLAIVAGLLAYENAIVRPNDLSRVNAAFFTTNGVLGVVFLIAVAVAVL
jgi:4-hydroxybenzoate polyprenyltransferase